MKQVKRIVVLMIVICMVCITPIKANNLVESFVVRLYENCLNRKPDQKGLKYWVNLLETKQYTAAKVVEGFFFSNEMNNLNLSNDAWVERCYKTLLDRKSDASGKAYWLNKMKKEDKRSILKGFVDSKEFTNICNKYNVTKGTIDTAVSQSSPTPILNQTINYDNMEIDAFVKRLYQNVLGRNAEASGLNYWKKLLLEKKRTPTQVATEGFFTSNEFRNKNVNDNDFVDILYRTFLNREAEKQGKNYWLAKLKTVSRQEVIMGFSNSKEFNNLIESSGWKETSNNYLKNKLNDPNSILVIANKKHKLPSSFEPNDLREANINKRGSILMRNEAASALERMFSDAARAGVYLYGGSGYRSYNTQVSTYNYWVSIDGQANADTYSARPGYSEHQTGLAIDIAGNNFSNYLSSEFGKTIEGRWLKENSYKYGYVLRYPQSKEHITGYRFEPWHFRYVGVDYATAIYSEGSDLTLEEYFGVEGGNY